jgi:hypothetical protein
VGYDVCSKSASGEGRLLQVEEEGRGEEEKELT